MQNYADGASCHFIDVYPLVGPFEGPQRRDLLLPLFVAHRQAVEGLAVMAPLGLESVHQGDEPGVVGRFEQVRHFVDDDVLQTLTRLLGKVGV